MPRADFELMTAVFDWPTAKRSLTPITQASPKSFVGQRKQNWRDVIHTVTLTREWSDPTCRNLP
jgi:hypothetical protein